MSRGYGFLSVVLLAAVLSGCSQIGALTPVGGAAITSVRNATNDVLIERGVEILVAPICERGAEAFTCKGSTVDGKDITAKAGLVAPYELRIDVGGEEVFSGTAQEVLDTAVLESS